MILCLIHAIISAFSRGKVEEASKLFAKLVEINDDAVDYFIDEDWPFKIPEIEELECY